MSLPRGRSELALLILALVGIAISGYLTWVHYADIDPVCTTGGCEKVQSSEYADLAGIPVAVLGLGGYIAIAASMLFRGELARTATAAFGLIGVGFSGYLTYLELFVIDAICQWCVASAVVMVAIAVLAVRALLTAPPPA